MKKSPLKSTKSLVAKKSLKSKTPLKSGGGRKQTKPTISKLKKDADKWYSKACRYRFASLVDGEWVAECITCQNGLKKPLKELQCGHFMSRQYNILRYDSENTAPQCYGCNVRQQGKQFEFGIQIDLLYGEGTAKKLHKISKKPHQFTVEELRQVIEDSREEIQFYERELSGENQ